MKGNYYSMKRAVPSQAVVLKQTIPIRSAAIQVDGATGVGFGSAVISDFPEGNIMILGAVANLQFTKAAGASGIQAAFDGDFAIGSAPAGSASLAGTSGDIIPSTALGAATAGVSPVVRGASTTTQGGSILDNTDGSLEMNLNLLIDDANISADDQDLTVTGELYIAYTVLGDD